MKIDLRSDTVTKPTPGMIQAMFEARVGDDVFEEDPTVASLETMLADLFDMEAGLFCPSGTMTNQIAIRLLTQPQDEVICDHTAHIYNYEGGGIAYNSMASVRLLNGNLGIITPEMVEENINPDNIHFPKSRMVALENTVNKGGGSIYSMNDIRAISAVCKKYDLKLHLDGARIFNALVETGENPIEYSQYFDTISICLSKGLGAPVGSVLLASQKDIKKAKRIRKVLGGGMRQAGYLAAAGIYAVNHHVIRLKEDHKRAKLLAESLSSLSVVISILPVETNIVVFSFENAETANGFLNYLSQNDILAVNFGKNTLRMVTHLDINDEMIDKVMDVIKKY